MLKSPPKGRYVLFVCYAPDRDDEAALHTRCAMLTPLLNERPRRRFTAADPAARGPGGTHRGARAPGRAPPGAAGGGGPMPRPPDGVSPSRPPPWGRSHADSTD